MNRKLQVVPTNEIKSVIQDCKLKMWNHIEMRNEFQVNQQFINYMEETIEKLTEVLKERNAA